MVISGWRTLCCITLLNLLLSEAPKGYCSVFLPEPITSETSQLEEYWSPLDITGAILSLILGALFCFFGYFAAPLTIFISGFLTIGVPLFLFLQGQGATTLLVVHLVIAGVIAGAFTWVVLCFRRILGPALLGAQAATVVVIVAWSGLLGQIWGDQFWFKVTDFCLLAAAIAAGIFLSLIISARRFISGCTAIIGSFFITAGMDFFLRDQWASVFRNVMRGDPTYFYPVWLSTGMVLLWLLIGLLGAACQYNITSRILFHKFFKSSSRDRSILNPPDSPVLNSIQA